MKSHFVLMARYNAWANARLYKIAADLSDALYRQDVGVFFKSLHGTLNHVLTADRIWLRRLTGAGSHPSALNAIVCDDLPSLTVARQQEDQRISEFVASRTEPQFEGDISYQMLNGTPHQQKLREMLAHLFNHQTHHRGQAHAALTMLGIQEPPSLDLMIMQRQ